MIALLLLLAMPQDPQIDWQRAEREIVRLSPAAFPALPPGIRRELTRRGCKVPQVWDEQRPHNVERGHFLSSKATDWIVLCSVKRSSSILVFRSRTGKKIAQLAKANDAGYLQGTYPPGKAGFSRRIRPMPAKLIRDYCKLWNQECPLVDHDGIDDSFEDKASWIRYFTGTKWLTLLGGD